MIRTPVLVVIAGVALGVAVGAAATIDPLRGPLRGGALRGDTAALHTAVMRAEERTPAGRASGDPRLGTTLERLDRAIAAQDGSAAAYLWRESYGLAVGSRRWEPMVALGDAALALGAVTGSRKSAEASARDAYLVALVRARRQGSSAGVLRVAEAIAALGDTAMAREVRRLSETMTARGSFAEF
jgi:hypothetical protein